MNALALATLAYSPASVAADDDALLNATIRKTTTTGVIYDSAASIGTVLHGSMTISDGPTITRLSLDDVSSTDSARLRIEASGESLVDWIDSGDADGMSLIMFRRSDVATPLGSAYVESLFGARAVVRATSLAWDTESFVHTVDGETIAGIQGLASGSLVGVRIQESTGFASPIRTGLVELQRGTSETDWYNPSLNLGSHVSGTLTISTGVELRRVRYNYDIVEGDAVVIINATDIGSYISSATRQQTHVVIGDSDGRFTTLAIADIANSGSGFARWNDVPPTGMHSVYSSGGNFTMEWI